MNIAALTHKTMRSVRRCSRGTSPTSQHSSTGADYTGAPTAAIPRNGLATLRLSPSCEHGLTTETKAGSLPVTDVDRAIERGRNWSVRLPDSECETARVFA